MPGEVLLIDNVDSFTYNVADLVHRVLGRAPVLWSHDHLAGAAELATFAAIVVGPGPGRPQVPSDMGLSDAALRQREVPVLGVCLGHQGLAHVAGERVAEMALTRHGIVSEVEHDGVDLFDGVPSPLRVVRYHSLEVAQPLRSGLRVTARSTDDGCVMGLADPERPFWGVQFHPESVLSEHGERIVANFLRLAGVELSEGAGAPQSVPDLGVDPGLDAGPVAIGDTLAAGDHEPGGRLVTMQARQVSGAGVDVAVLRDLLLADAPTSVWLDASDGRGWSLLADSRGPLAFELAHRVGEGLPLLDRLDVLLDGWRPRASSALDDPACPPWRPGFVGYWGYELKAETGGVAAHRSPWPDAWLTFADRGVVVDHDARAVWAIWLEDARVEQEQRAWVEQVAAAVTRAPADADAQEQSHHERGSVGLGATTRDARSGERVEVAVPRHDETAYLELVRRAQREIARGESYEVCLTTTYAAPGTGVDEAALYRALRQVSPVPHGAWLRTPEVSILSGSPERFVSVQGGSGVVEARPIKGTRPRGATPEQDAALAADLATAVKDRAENLMIVDLLRNDLHRVCRSGSVHVPEIFAVETYATLHQLVSTVRGELAAGMRPTHVLRSCFPGGSMTGAPKVRTMEILDSLEGAARGVYSGAIGWIGLDGSMDTSIVIRTVTWGAGEVTFGVGGAVTALSDPDEEYAETRAKARSMLQALALARADSG